MLVHAFEGMRNGGGERWQSASDARVLLHVVRRSNRIAARHARAALAGSEKDTSAGKDECREGPTDRIWNRAASIDPLASSRA